jgi:hypothetical protein
MKKIISFLTLLPVLLMAQKETASANYTNNRSPLIAKPYVELPLGAIKPLGWLDEQMKRMAIGMTGNLDVQYSKVVGSRNGWLGGDGDVWERGPYWVDGLLPLAYIMKDQKLINKVQPWIEWTLASQKASGYFGPEIDRGPEPGLQRDNAKDWWPKMVVLKIMQQYYSATNDKRVIPFLTNYFKYQLKELPKDPLGKWTFWGEQRGGDNLMVVYWLYSVTGDKFLLDLGELIHKQTFDWTDVFLNRNDLSRQHSTHGVNLAQGFKAPTIYSQANTDSKYALAPKKAINDMRHTIGFPTGLWAADEMLRFGNPTQGSELCTAVEMMFSLENMLAITGDVQWADQLERITYNVLPSQISADFNERQYYQQINQTSMTKESRNFVTSHNNTDNLMGLLTGYPCCTTNMHQGWPKFTQNLWYATADNGIAALIYAPSEVVAKVANGTAVKITETTNYPFKENINFKFQFVDKKVKQGSFPFHLRIPSWCEKPELFLNGKKLEVSFQTDRILKINGDWKNGDELIVNFPMKVAVSYWFDGAAVLERGPLLYGLKMNEKWTAKNDPVKFGNYHEITSDSPWNYCLLDKYLKAETLQESVTITQKAEIASYPWTLQDAPITLSIKAKRLPWGEYKGSPGPIQYFSQIGDKLSDEEEVIQLIPFGCTKLRITEFPVR